MDNGEENMHVDTQRLKGLKYIIGGCPLPVCWRVKQLAIVTSTG